MIKINKFRRPRWPKIIVLTENQLSDLIRRTQVDALAADLAARRLGQEAMNWKYDPSCPTCRARAVADGAPGAVAMAAEEEAAPC